jgi:hypothetical protein
MKIKSYSPKFWVSRDELEALKSIAESSSEIVCWTANCGLGRWHRKLRIALKHYYATQTP